VRVRWSRAWETPVIRLPLYFSACVQSRVWI
jgi:hypothetical protein